MLAYDIKLERFYLKLTWYNNFTKYHVYLRDFALEILLLFNIKWNHKNYYFAYSYSENAVWVENSIYHPGGDTLAGIIVGVCTMG